MGGRAPMTPERFWARTEWQDGCLIWTDLLQHGYGRLKYQGRYYKAHRLAWELTHGAIPSGLEVCHHCDRPACVLPAHLWLATHKENMQDMGRKGRAPATVAKRRREG